MKRTTLLFLAVLFGVLFLLVRRRDEAEREQPGLHVLDRALFPELSPLAVTAIRIDNLERAVQIRLERDVQGNWFLTDPVAYPALDALPTTLLANLRRFRGLPVGAGDLGELGLDPPKVVVEIDENLADGLRTSRIEIGSLDLDGKRVHARIPGHPAGGADGALLLRVPRPLYTFLDRNPDDYRNRRATHLRVGSVAGLRREGRLVLERHGPVDLAFSAERVEERWRTAGRPRVSLDLDAVGLLVRAAAELPIAKFVDDSPEDLAPYGLEEPLLRIELEDERGAVTALRLGYRGDAAPEAAYWFATREGSGHVWNVDWQDMAVLAQPSELLYDYRLLRSFREDVRRVELEGQGGGALLELREGDWQVSSSAGGDVAYPASHGAVEDVLSRIERTQLDDYQPGVPFARGDPPASVAIVTRDGRRWGGEIGGLHRDPATGTEGRLFLRFGDDLPAIVDGSLHELTALTLDELRRRQVHAVENLVERVEIAREEGSSLGYVRREDDWYPSGSRLALPPASDFFPVLERFANLRVEAWLEPGTPLAGDAPITVTLSGDFDSEKRFRVLRTADGRVACRFSDGQLAALREEDLVLLRRLLE